MTRVYSIFERIGLGGGGKVKAVYHRMNALAEMDEFEPILLSIDHCPRRKLNFAELQATGSIACAPHKPANIGHTSGRLRAAAANTGHSSRQCCAAARQVSQVPRT